MKTIDFKAHMSNANLSNANLRNAILSNAKLIGCVVSEIKRSVMQFSLFGDHRQVTSIHTNKGIKIFAGCFDGSLDVFKKGVRETLKPYQVEEYELLFQLIEKHYSIYSMPLATA